MDSASIRQIFLDFFKSKQHAIVSSAPMVVKNDPTLMFTNAGMNQFKDIFLGNQEAPFRRIADTQKCLRVSGKHNDLEEVGHDTYHHTMFEMLGNWSFGDYFKKEAIEWGWELLTAVYGIDKERLYVTVFEGDENEGLGRDEESLVYWRAIVPEDRILMGSKKDNFWEMGDTGPCGPCSEIHIDIRDADERQKIPGASLVNTGNPLVIEIWNLVFIEFNRQSNGSLISLPAKHVDTGMGFERLCMVLQGTHSNYDTDVFQPILRAIAERAGKVYGRDERADIAMRVIADHLRAIAFAIADGQLPSNVKAGYVIRRILRRAVRYGFAFLDIREPFLCELLPVLNQQMGFIFPELMAQKNLITNVIREEEIGFLRTLSLGIQRFNQYIQQYDTQATAPAGQIMTGDFAFELFDTFGFPIDLTHLMAREIGWTVDMEGFGRRLEEQKARSRQDAAVEAGDWTLLIPDAGTTTFVGYDTLETPARIVKYRKVTSKGREFFQVILDQTPFYAASGGQVGDRGWLKAGEERIEVSDTLKENELVVHIAPTLFTDPTVSLTAQVDAVKRQATANNHSATHLMHAALRRVLGNHVEQKGSLVDDQHLRFDFTHFTRVTREEIRQVEAMVNARIRENIPLQEERFVPIDEARARGAMALFGEKYGDRVRVITFDPAYSLELCGGTHVAATGQIGSFKILSEGAIAAGIRRIEAITAEKAEDYWNSRDELIEQISELLKDPKDLVRGVRHLLDEHQALKQEVNELSKLKINQLIGEYTSKIERNGTLGLLAEKVQLPTEEVKNLGYELTKANPDLFLVFAAESDGKALLTVMLSESLVKERHMNAGSIIRELAKEIGGGGGGQPHIATAGGKNPSGIPAALEKARQMARSFNG